MDSKRGLAAETKQSTAMQFMEKGILAFNEKDFIKAEKCCQIGLRSNPEPVEKYPLLYCLASAKASQHFFAKEYDEAIAIYANEIKKLNMEAHLLKESFNQMKVENEKYEETRELFRTCTLALGILYSRKAQVHYFLSLVYETHCQQASFDFSQGELFGVENCVRKLKDTTKYVVAHLNRLPQNKDKKNDLTLFKCAENYWDGLQLFNLKKYAEAIVYFEKGLQICPYDAYLLEYIAHAEFELARRCQSEEEKNNLLTSVVAWTTKATQYRHQSTVYLLRGIANTYKKEWKLAFDDFKFVMAKEIFFEEEDSRELVPFFQNAVKSFCFSQLQLARAIDNTELAAIFLNETSNLHEKLNKDEYRSVHVILSRMALKCKQKKEFGMAENTYLAALWMAIKLKFDKNLISTSAAQYLDCIFPRINREISGLNLEDINGINHLLSLLSKNKLVLMKEPLNAFIQSLITYAESQKTSSAESVKNFYTYAQMLSQADSQIYRLTNEKLKALNGTVSEEKPVKKSKKRKHKVKNGEKSKQIEDTVSALLQLQMPTAEPAKTIQLESKKEFPVVAVNAPEVKTVALPVLEKKEPQKIKLITTSIQFHPAVWTISYCMQKADVKQVYMTGETFLYSLSPAMKTTEIEMVFGAINPSACLEKAFPHKKVQQDGMQYKVIMHDDFVVRFRNSEAMNKVAQELECSKLTPGKIKKIKYAALQEDAKNRNDFSMCLLYGECVNETIVSYDLSPNQKGFDDLSKKKIRFVRETSMALAENPELALKVIYYSQMWSANISKSILKEFVEMKSCEVEKAIVKSPNLINDWFKKLFLHGWSLQYFNCLRELHVLEKFIPQFSLLSHEPTDIRAKTVLEYLQFVMAQCDAIVKQSLAVSSSNEVLSEYQLSSIPYWQRADFNLIYASWNYAIKLLNEYTLLDKTLSVTGYATLFNHSHGVSGEERAKLSTAAENRWKFNFKP